MRRAIIYGHPHSGSSILKCILGSSPGVHEVIKEGLEAPDCEGKLSLVKWPLWSTDTVEPRGHRKIFIMRNPAYALYSLHARFRGVVPLDHQRVFTAQYWHDLIERADKASWTPGETFLRYEQIFNHDTLRHLCASLGVQPPANPYGQYIRRITESPVPETEPPRYVHADFRQYQLNLPVRNMNNPENTYADLALLDEIRSHPLYNRIIGG